jgi:hypothetical protein
MVLLDKYCAGNRKPNSALLWEYDVSNFDWQKSKVIVVQRVVEMGEPEDFFAAFDLYGGIDEFKAIVRTVPYLNNLDMHFVCTLFNLKKEELRCYTRKQSNQELWIY